MSSRRVLAMVMVVGAVALTGCPDTGIVCRTGTNRCGTGCADYASDRRNCGGCGPACAASQVCVATGSDGGVGSSRRQVRVSAGHGAVRGALRCHGDRPERVRRVRNVVRHQSGL